MENDDYEEELIGPEPLLGPAPGRPPARGDLYGTERPKKSAEIVNVREWTSKWEYQPGCQFVRISRENPKTWQGIQIGGVIEEMDEPFDTHYLRDTWGGGVYKLYAIQLDPDGRSRTADRKTVTISGVPTHFMGPEDQPVELPQDKRVQDSMRYRNRSHEEEDERHREAPVSAADLYYATQANMAQNRGSDPETLEVLRNAQNDANQHMRMTMEAQQRLSAQTIEQQDRELSRMRDSARESERNAHAPFNYAMQMMESRSNVEMQNMRAQLDSMRAEHSQQMQMMQSQHSRVLESYQRELDRVRDDARMREEQVRSLVSGQYQGQLAALENRALMAEQNAMRNVEMARTDADRRESQMKMMLEHSYDGRMQLLLSDKGRLETELDNTRRELTEYRTVAMEIKDPITQLTQMQGLVSAVQSFTGNNDEPKVDAPEDFIGKVAHYGPGFARHFLTPILSRVDAATQVANRGLAAKEDEIRAVEAYNENQAPPQALPEPSRRPAERRLPGAHAPPVPQPQYHQPGVEPGVQLHSPPPPDDVYQPGPGEGVVPDGMRRLVEFLEEKMEMNAAPEEAASELVMGVEMGVVPPEVMQEFVMRPKDEVLGDIAAASHFMEKPSVTSPRGARFVNLALDSLVNALQAGEALSE